MKGVASCDKPRGAAEQAVIRGFPNGETHRAVEARYPGPKSQVSPGGEPREVKHLSSGRKRNQHLLRKGQARPPKAGVEIPLVAASERGRAQTSRALKPAGVARGGLWDGNGEGCGPPRELQKPPLAEQPAKPLERATGEGDSPVGERGGSPGLSFPSSVGHGESGANPGGPPSKAKYYRLTDSAPVP